MGQSFDPYAQWLGIPADEQPPDHYRLLGLPRFAGSRETIAKAVEARVALLQEYRTGPQAEAAARMAAEIVAAGTCLLDPERKTEYDRRLRQADVPIPPVQWEPPAAVAWDDVRSKVYPAREAGSSAGKRRKRTSAAVKSAKIVGGGVAGILLAGVILWYGFGVDPLRVISKGNGRESPAQGTTGIASADGTAAVSQADSAGGATGAASQLPASHASSGKAIRDREEPGHASAAEAAHSQTDPAWNAFAESSSLDPTGAAFSTGAAPMVGTEGGVNAGGPRPAKPDIPPVADQADWLPVTSHTQNAATAQNAFPAATAPVALQAAEPPIAPPSADVEKQITASLEKVFNLDKAGSRAEAQQKLQQLRAALGDSGTTDDERYVLLQLAGRQALAAGEVDALWDSWTQLTINYACDAGMLLKGVLSGQRSDVYWITRVAAESAVAISQACRQGRVEQAAAAVDALSELARTARPERATVALWCLGEARTLLKQAADWYREYRFAQARLGMAPQDAEAHRAAGRWLCLGADDWDAGLPHLAACGDSLLAEAAKAEQAMDANVPTALAAVAHRWWQYAEKADRSEQPYFRAHAVQLYQRALLPRDAPLSALEKAGVEKLLEQPEAQAAKPLGEQIAAALRGGPSLRDKWVELGPLTRLGMAPQQGEVALGTRGLVLGQMSGIYLPMLSSGSYDLKAVFTRLKGDDSVSVELPVAGTGCLAVLSGWRGQCHGIGLIDGREGNANPTKRTPGTIPNGVLLTWEIAVRVRAPLCSIQAALNRTPLFAWQGKISSLTVPQGFPADRIGIHNYLNEATVFHSVSVRPLDEKAVLVFGD